MVFLTDKGRTNVIPVMATLEKTMFLLCLKKEIDLLAMVLPVDEGNTLLYALLDS